MSMTTIGEKKKDHLSRTSETNAEEKKERRFSLSKNTGKRMTVGTVGKKKGDDMPDELQL
jgi:hypothetical protein